MEGFKNFDFSDRKCQSKYDDSILEKWEKTKARRKQKDNESNEGNIKQNSQPQSSVAQTPSPPVETGTSSSIPDNGSDTLESKDKVVGDAQNKSNPKGSEQTDPGSDTGNKTNLQSNPSSHTPISGTNQGGGSGDGFIGPQNDRLRGWVGWWTRYHR